MEECNREKIKEAIKKNLTTIAICERVNAALYHELCQTDHDSGMTAEETLKDLVPEVDIAPNGEHIITNDYTMPGGHTVYRVKDQWFVGEPRD